MTRSVVGPTRSPFQKSSTALQSTCALSTFQRPRPSRQLWPQTPHGPTHPHPHPVRTHTRPKPTATQAELATHGIFLAATPRFGDWPITGQRRREIMETIGLVVESRKRATNIGVTRTNIHKHSKPSCAEPPTGVAPCPCNNRAAFRLSAHHENVACTEHMVWARSSLSPWYHDPT